MQPLKNVTIIELSTMITASFAAMMAAEQGARVIKVEPIDAGDPMRYIGASKGGISGLFANCNRGKESLRIDLKSTEGQRVVQRLASQADVLVSNYRPGVLDRLNLGSETLRTQNPRLIYVAISGFGLAGAMRQAPAYDPIIQAQVGMTASQGVAQPTFIRNLICDKITAYTACQAFTAALFERSETGHGQHIDLSMMDASLFYLFPDAFMNDTLLDEDVAPQPLLADLMYELTETKDGAITISAAAPAMRLGVYRALDRMDLATDPRFATLEALQENFLAYRTELADAFAGFDTETILARLRENDVPCARCLNHAEVLNHEQLLANRSIAEAQHPSMGRLRQIRSPARFQGADAAFSRPAPSHGQDTARILDELEIEPATQAEWAAAGIIPGSPP